MSWGNTEKYKNFSVRIEKEIRKADKDGIENSTTIFLQNQNSLIVRDLYSLSNLRIMSQKEFTKLNIKMVIVFLNIEASRII